MYASASFTQFRSSGVWSCGPNGTAWSQLNHAVLLIGYDEDGNYIIKNSWGKLWGDKGYAKIDRQSPCGIGMYIAQLVNTTAPIDSNLRADSSKLNPTAKSTNGAARIFSACLSVFLLMGLLF